MEYNKLADRAAQKVERALVDMKRTKFLAGLNTEIQIPTPIICAMGRKSLCFLQQDPV